MCTKESSLFGHQRSLFKDLPYILKINLNNIQIFSPLRGGTLEEIVLLEGA